MKTIQQITAVDKTITHLANMWAGIKVYGNSKPLYYLVYPDQIVKEFKGSGNFEKDLHSIHKYITEV